MKKKLLGIFICTLLITTVFLAAGSLDNTFRNQPVNESINNDIYELIVNNGCNCPYQEYALGYVPVPDWVERTRLSNPTKPLLADLDWRNNGGDYTTPAKNQRRCGSCWAHSAMGALESMIEIANSNPSMNPDLSEQYVLSCTGAQGTCPNDCVSGGNAYWAFWYMKDGAPLNGALPESCFSYQAIDANGCDYDDCNNPPIPCSNKCPTWQSQLIQTITSYGLADASHGLTSAQIKAQLANGPVCLMMEVYVDFNLGPGHSPSFDLNGVYRYDHTSPYVGPHFVLCVGYQDSLNCWICKNSWGAGWGTMNGFFKIAYGECNIEDEMSWVTFTPTGNHAPIVSITSPSSGATVSSSITISGTASDSDGTVTQVEVCIDSGSWWTVTGTTSWTTSWDTTTVSDGSHTINARSKDNQGAYSTYAALPVIVSNAVNNPPTVSITSPSSGATVSSSIYIQGTASDSDGTVTQVEVCIDSGSWWTVAGTTSWAIIWDTTTVSDGSHTINARSKDNKGAYSTLAARPVIVNNAANNNPPNKPSTPNGPPTGVTGVQYQYTTSATDPDSGDIIKYGLDFNNDGIVDPGQWTVYYASGATCTLGITFAAQGTYYLSVKAEDNHGAQSTFSSVLTVVISAGTNNPPTVSITSPSSGATVSSSITISGTASDSDGTVTQVEVCIDSGSWWSATGTTSWTTSWDTTTVSDGSHTISARSKDNKGAFSTFTSVPITVSNVVNNQPNQPSTPTGQTSGKAGRTYQYNSSAVDPEGDQVSLLFDWGDGTDSGWLTPVDSGQNVTASHSWSKANYEIKVKARDIPNLAESTWSDPLPITMPYSYNPMHQSLEQLFQRFPNAFPVLRQLIGY